MVWQRKEVLDAYDWRLLGLEMDQEDPHVPMKRCDMPIPYNKDGLFSLARRLADLSVRIRDAASDEKESARTAIRQAMRDIYAMKQEFADLADDWSREYAELMKAPHLKLTTVEPFRTKQATGE